MFVWLFNRRIQFSTFTTVREPFDYDPVTGCWETNEEDTVLPLLAIFRKHFQESFPICFRFLSYYYLAYFVLDRWQIRVYIFEGSLV